MTAEMLERQRAPLWWREHWLACCEDFRVERAGLSLGFVETVERGDAGEAEALLVWRRDGGRLRVAADDVAEVDPSRCLVVLVA